MIDSIIVIAKEPVAGRVKTRLVPPLTYSQAADVAAGALDDTLRTAAGAPARAYVLALDGAAGSWLPSGWQVVTQAAGGLDVRLTSAFASVPEGSALLVGMDTPQMCPGHLESFDAIRFDACIGPAADGGYWAIGFRDSAMAAQVIPGVPMSAPHTGEVQLRRMHAAGLSVQILEELVDVDTIDDALHVARLVPGSSFAHAVINATRDLRVPIEQH
jgi:hypothetical protein